MCLAIHENGNRRARTFLSIGMLCLVVSLLSQTFSVSFGLSATPLHFLRGFFLGIAIPLNFSAAFLIARERRTRS
jgi:hypothetical protein